MTFGRSMTFKGWPAAKDKLAAFCVAGTTHCDSPGQSSAGSSTSNQIEIYITNQDKPKSELYYRQANPPQTSTANTDTKFFLNSSLDCQWGRISKVMPVSNSCQPFRHVQCITPCKFGRLGFRYRGLLFICKNLAAFYIRFIWNTIQNHFDLFFIGNWTVTWAKFRAFFTTKFDTSLFCQGSGPLSPYVWLNSTLLSWIASLWKPDIISDSCFAKCLWNAVINQGTLCR